MASFRQTMIEKLEYAIIAKLLCNSVGVVKYDLWVNHMKSAFDLQLIHADGYCHLISHHDAFNLIAILDRYLNPELEEPCQ